MDIELRHVVILTNQFKIEGQIRVPATSYRGRVSDFLNQGEQMFIPIMNPIIAQLGGAALPPLPESILLNKNSIIVAYELTEGMR